MKVILKRNDFLANQWFIILKEFKLIAEELKFSSIHKENNIYNNYLDEYKTMFSMDCKLEIEVSNIKITK